MNDNTLSCTNLVKEYSGKKVLDDISLIIEPNKIYGLIGRNGAGKTTMLSILTAQNPATKGTTTYGGEQVWENQDALDNLCFSRELSPTMNNANNSLKAKEYLKMASIYYPNWDKDYAQRLIDIFELDVKKRIYKLSKGMLSMITIVVALASKANITILDEPVAGLDVVAREQFYKLLVEEYARTGRTFVISTHIIEEAANVFEEVIILDKGKILMKEITDDLVSSCHLISGKADEVEAVVAGLEVLHTETIGRSKAVCVRMKKGQKIQEHIAGKDVDMQPVSLQKIFVYLTGGIKEEH